MKKILLVIGLIISFNGIAQNLEHKIPNNAKAVITANGDQILDLISLAELNNTSVIKKLLSSENLESINDLGFNLNTKAHYFYQMTDSVQYHNFIASLTNKTNFEKLLNEKETEKIEEYLGYKYLFEKDKVTVWNDKILLVSIADLPYKPYDYLYTPPAPPVIEEYEMESEEVKPIDGNEIEEIEEIQEVEENKEPYSSVTKIEKNDYSQYDKIDESTKNLLKNNVLSILNCTKANSIATNKKYNAGKQKNAVSYAWVANYNSIMTNLMQLSMSSSMFGKMDSNADIIGINEVTANLFFNEDEIKLTSVVNVSDDWKSIYKKMNGTLDSEFFKYFNQNETLAYFSLAMDMQGVLEEYPRMMTKMYSALMPNFKEETSVAIDLISVILDEKAIGELITGDALFILNDIAEKEVTYTTYTYDDDYKRSEITKTKMEVIPDFTMMLGSENKALISRIMKLAIKHKVAAQNANYFTFDKKTTDAPFDMFFVVKDDIAFLTNSKKQISNITSNHFSANVGKHKSRLKKNISTLFIDSKKIISKVPDTYLNDSNRDFLQFAQDNIDETYFTYSKLKGNKYHSTHVIKTSKNQGNSLKLIFKMIEDFRF